MKRTSTRGYQSLLALLLAQAVAGCVPESGGPAVLREFTAEVSAYDIHMWPETTTSRSLYVSLHPPRSHEGPEHCVSLASARVSFNGQPAEVMDLGRADPSNGLFDPAGCDGLLVAIPAEDAPRQPVDATLEIEGDGERFVVAVPRFYGLRDLTLARIEGMDAIFEASFPLEGAADATWQTGGKIGLPARIENGTIRVDLTEAPAPTGRMFLYLRAEPQVSRCEGFAGCGAKLSVTRSPEIAIPGR